MRCKFFMLIHEKNNLIRVCHYGGKLRHLSFPKPNWPRCRFTEKNEHLCSKFNTKKKKKFKTTIDLIEEQVEKWEDSQENETD